MHKERTMPSPVILTAQEQRACDEGFIAQGSTMGIQLWEGSAPYELHVHHAHDELFRALEVARTGRSHTDWGKRDDPAIYAAYESELLEIARLSRSFMQRCRRRLRSRR
jgi:hypothetical protein